MQSCEVFAINLIYMSMKSLITVIFAIALTITNVGHKQIRFRYISVITIVVHLALSLLALKFTIDCKGWWFKNISTNLGNVNILLNKQ